MVFVYDTASENLLQTNGPYKKATLLALYFLSLYYCQEIVEYKQSIRRSGYYC